MLQCFVPVDRQLAVVYIVTASAKELCPALSDLADPKIAEDNRKEYFLF